MRHFLEQINGLGVHLLFLHADAREVKLHVPENVLASVLEQLTDLRARQCFLLVKLLEARRQMFVTVSCLLIKVTIMLSK